jgi:hypothetical protein
MLVTMVMVSSSGDPVANAGNLRIRCIATPIDLAATSVRPRTLARTGPVS